MTKTINIGQRSKAKGQGDFPFTLRLLPFTLFHYKKHLPTNPTLIIKQLRVFW
jgi:hypothetical protein